MSFAVGDRVRLKACNSGEPGAVLRIERRKLVIYFGLDFIGRHVAESLVLVEGAINAKESAQIAPEASRDRLSTKGIPIDDILNRAAEELAEGRANEVKERAYADVREEEPAKARNAAT
jgi:hypothetical protein